MKDDDVQMKNIERRSTVIKIFSTKASVSLTDGSVSASTPRSDVDSAMRHESISPIQAPNLRKKLILQSAVISELQAAAQSSKAKISLPYNRRWYNQEVQSL